MTHDSVDYARGETPMTDYQFKQYEALSQECNTLRQELINLLNSQQSDDSESLSDCKFKEYELLRDKLEETLQHKSNHLQTGQPSNKSKGMTDYQFKCIMDLKDENTALKRKNESIVQTVSKLVEAGKSPEEILSAIESITAQPE